MDIQTTEAIKKMIETLTMKAKQIIASASVDEYGCGYVGGLEDAAFMLSKLTAENPETEICLKE